MDTKKIIILGAVGVGAFALMSFGKAPKTTEQEPQPQPQPTYVPPTPVPVYVPPVPVYVPPTPVYVAPAPVVIPEPVYVPPVVIPEPVYVVPTPIVIQEPIFLNHDKGVTLEVISLNKSTFLSFGKYANDVNLKISNWNYEPILANEIKKIDIRRTDTNANLGVQPVNFNEISIPANQSVIFNNVILNTTTSVSSYVLPRLQLTAIFGVIDPTVVIEATDSLISNQYVVQDKNVLAYATKRGSMKVNGAYIDMGYNVTLENNTDEPFYLQTVKAIRISIKYGYGFSELSVQPFNFSNIKIDAHEQTELLNMVFSVPYEFDRIAGVFKGLSKALIDTSDTRLKTDVKLDLLY